MEDSPEPDKASSEAERRWHGYWIISVAASIVVFAALVASNAIYVHYYFGGEYYGPFLYSEHWGITSVEREAGLLPVYTDADAGWDGQFYYRQSLDPFLLGEGPKVSDNVSYRYQRNGVSIIAWVAGKLLGYQLTPAWLYQAVQFAIIAIGFGFITYFLIVHRLSTIYAFAWLLSTALWSLAHGLPDTAADALFVVSCVALLSKRLYLYVLACSFLLLAREGYATFAAAVFLLTLFRAIRWSDQDTFKTAIVSAIPGVILIGWTAYVARMLGMPMLAGAKVLSFGSLVDYPFHAFYRAISTQYSVHETRELVLKSLAAATILVVLVQAVWYSRRSPLQLAAIPYLVLMSMTGFTVWENETGYLKTTGAVILIGILQMPLGKSYLLKLLICSYMVMGCYTCYHFNYKYQPCLYKQAIIGLNELPPSESPSLSQVNLELENIACEITAEQSYPTSDAIPFEGMLSAFHRTPYVYRVAVKNLLEKTLYAQSPSSPGRVGVNFQLIDKSTGSLQYNQQRLIRSDIAPGAIHYESICLPVPATGGPYELVVGISQNDSLLGEDKGYRFLRIPVAE